MTKDDLCCLNEKSSALGRIWFVTGFVIGLAGTAKVADETSETVCSDKLRLRSNEAESGEGGISLGSCGRAFELGVVGCCECVPFLSSVGDMEILAGLCRRY